MPIYVCKHKVYTFFIPFFSLLQFFHFLLPKLEAVKMDPRFLDRNVNEGFSGGEKKRNEILQLAV